MRDVLRNGYTGLRGDRPYDWLQAVFFTVAELLRNHGVRVCEDRSSLRCPPTQFSRQGLSIANSLAILKSDRTLLYWTRECEDRTIRGTSILLRVTDGAVAYLNASTGRKILRPSVHSVSAKH
jgi:hypothetical protein